ncbi:HNH endonuclease [Cupriavidus sp. NPDC089707]|uniref:HNH endonuclease n=1 Tax=Cupriavidus sp. NPDC089707 TaxID=3363963 RepID=UPI003802A71E
MSRQWALDNPEAVREKWRRQNAKRANAGPKWTSAQIAEIRRKLKDRCYYCGISLNGEGEIDHMVSLECGGTNAAENLTLACIPCNRQKGARSAEEFLLWLRADGRRVRRFTL